MGPPHPETEGGSFVLCRACSDILVRNVRLHIACRAVQKEAVWLTDGSTHTRCGLDSVAEALLHVQSPLDRGLDFKPLCYSKEGNVAGAPGEIARSFWPKKAAFRSRPALSLFFYRGPR